MTQREWSSTPMSSSRASIDPDDGAVPAGACRIVAALDYPYDVDYFHLPLRAGETVRIRVDSTGVDPYLSIDYPFADDVISDDDSGGGVLE